MPNGSDFLRDAVGTDGDSVRTEEKVNGALHGRNGVWKKFFWKKFKNGRKSLAIRGQVWYISQADTEAEA